MTKMANGKVKGIVMAALLCSVTMPHTVLAAWPLGNPKVAVDRDGSRVALTSQYRSNYFKVFIQTSDGINVLYRKRNEQGVWEWRYHKLSAADEAYVRRHYQEFIFPADTVFTIRLKDKTVTMRLQDGRWVERPVRGSGASSSTSSSSGSSSGGIDEEPQDDDPVDGNDGHDGSDPLCRLTGTCGGTSSSSTSSSSGASSSSSSGSSSSGGSSSSSSSSSSSGASSSSSSSGSSSGGTIACPLKNDVFLNPFNKDSAHHKPIGTGAVYAPESDPRNQNFHHFDSFGINVGAPWGNVAIQLTGAGEMVTVNKKEAKASGLPVTIRMPAGGVTLENPDGAPDNQFVLTDLSTRIMHHFRGYEWAGGRPVAMQYRQYQHNSLGHGTRMGERVGTSASGVAAPFGILRGEEANVAGRPIQHALQMIAPRKPGCFNLLSKEVILPAVSMDGNADEAPYNQGKLPYGTLLAIPPESKGGPKLESLGLSESGLRLARAVRDYGIYLVDGGGCGPAIRADQNVDKRLFMSDIPKFYGHIRVVSNSEWNRSQVATGGGEPIAPNCAFDAP